MSQNDLQRNILDAIRLSRVNQNSNMGSRTPRTFIFNEPGNAFQQKTPIVEVPRGGDHTIGIESTGEREMMMEYIKKIMNQINQQKQWRLIMRNMLPMIQGQMGRANMQGGPFVRPGRGGKPEYGAMLQGRIPF